MPFIENKCYEFLSSEEQATITILVINIEHSTITGRICGTEKIITLSLSKISNIKEVGCTNCG